MTIEERLLDPSGGLGPVPLGFLFTRLGDGVLEATVRGTLESKGQLPGGVRAALDRRPGQPR